MNFVKNFGVIFCCETCQSKNDEFLLDGYKCYCVTCKVSGASTRKSRRWHGGVCLFVKENLSKGVNIVETDNRCFIWAKFDELL